MSIITSFKRKKLERVYTTYLKESGICGKHDILNAFCAGNKKYKAAIFKMFDTAIANKDKNILQFCIGVALRDEIDNDYSDIFYKVILETWHDEHEDIVDIVWEFKEERFCDALLTISLDETTYRKFDDENESTLRKCIHALLAINTKKSIDLVEKLRKTKNPNVQYVLDMYKKPL